MAKPNKAPRVISPAWWVLYGLLCGLGMTGLLLFLTTPPRGAAVALRPASESSVVLVPITSATRTPLPTAGPLRVNINTAALQDLELLPNIGPSMAQAIMAYRERHGGFTSLDELLNVPGIGPKTFEGLQGFVALEDE
ncbi:MAG: helix-hairpin-helix domain-containing protein [Anaerolineales bacterium]|nr:helix-hairpin-helix domain-containing protein [Anaerolineales bacterium]